MISKLNKIFQNDFFKNVGKLASGTMLAQIIVFLTIPITARIYPHEAFGLLAIFLSIVNFISSFATLKYDTALVIPENDKDAYTLLKLSNICTLLITLICVSTLYLPLSYFKKLEGLEILIGIAVLLSVNYNNSALWNIRFKKFSQTAKATIIQAIAIFIFQYILYKNFHISGLIIGNILGVLVSGFYLVYSRDFDWKLYFTIGREDIRNKAERYVDFPRYFTPSNAILSLSSNLPILFFAKYIPLAQLGLYGLAIRILGQPVALVTNSIRSVILSELSERKRKNIKILDWYIKLLVGLFFTSIMISIMLGFFSKMIVEIILGPKWLQVSEYIIFLLPLFVSMFISSPSGAAVRVFELQKYNLKYSIFSLVSKLSLLYICFNLIDIEFKYIIFIYALSELILVFFNNLFVLNKIRCYEKSL